jgi:D-glycerate 3-kinase
MNLPQETLERVCEPLAARIARLRQVKRRTIVIGLAGAQGLGKSTIAEATKVLLEERGLTTVVLSLDDFYLTKAARERLAAEVHPLLATRGPPGTHDIALAGAVIDQLKARGKVSLPRFDKAADDRVPRGRWETVASPVDVILFEGWCLGARAQGQSALDRAVNDLERDEDPKGVWRAYVNDQLDGPYQTLFARLQELIFLKAPSFEVVARWRSEQERNAGGPMDEDAIARFIAHYERITRWMFTDLPDRARWTIEFDEDRHPISEDLIG